MARYERVAGLLGFKDHGWLLTVFVLPRGTRRGLIPETSIQSSRIACRASAATSHSRVQEDQNPRPAAFIVGVPRSGTTLLRMMLDSHPEMAIPPESHFYFELLKRSATGEMTAAEFYDFITGFFTWKDFAIDPGVFRAALGRVKSFTLTEALRIFYGVYGAKFGKTRWGEKTPDYGNVMEEIEALLPEAHFIHIIRDGRDVALSKRHLWFGPGESILAQAEDWTRWIMQARASGTRCRHYKEVRYEELLASPAQILREICGFLALPFREEMLAYHETAGERLEALQGWRELELTGDKLRSVLQLTTEPPRLDRVARWKRELPEAEVRLFEEIAGPILEELGYEVGAIAPAPGTVLSPSRKTARSKSVTALLLTDGIAEEALPWFSRVREQVDEFVIWIDSQKTSSETEARARRFATRIEYFAPNGFADPFHLRAIETCRTDWILRLDSDEELSGEWEQPDWRELLDLEYTNFALPRRWITPAGKYLARTPWWPDFQVRLIRNTPSKMRFGNAVHGTLEMEGRRGFCRTLALHHHVLRMLSRAAREEKVRFYQNLAGPDLGHYYLFEGYAVSEAPVPPPLPFDLENELLRMGLLFPREISGIRVDALAVPVTADAVRTFTITVQVTNKTTRELSSAPPFPVHLCYHWIDKKSGDVAVFDGERTPLFPPVPAHGTTFREMLIAAPLLPGEYVLHLTAVQEGVRWFEQADPGFGRKALVKIQ